MSFKEYEVVQVLRPVPMERVAAELGEALQPQAGDTGTILVVHPVPAGAECAYTVECVDQSGGTRWVADLLQSELTRFQAGGEGAA